MASVRAEEGGGAGRKCGEKAGAGTVREKLGTRGGGYAGRDASGVIYGVDASGTG
ncbi:hypothetical protein GCM10023318_27040 [Nocardia callitridis]|uniref:Uncharacterized protein n=1 Tax=Nocardia callitridis TaxID=648753 RepID=A0ABP9K821_9NOCA